MKAILISIRPKWCAKILNGDKTAEIRRGAPKNWKDYLSGKTKVKPEPMTGYIYCTKGNRFLFKSKSGGHYLTRCLVGSLTPLNAKVVAKFTLNEIEEICFAPFGGELTEQEERFCSESCLSVGELVRYLRDGMFGYSWHISDLVIFDEPMELNEFDYLNPSGIVTVSQRSLRGLPKRPPQSWCYVEANK